MSLTGRDLVSILDLSRKELDLIFTVARSMEERPSDFGNLLKGTILATLFFEPSTRTRLSFEAAMLRLGGSIIGFSGVESTSLMKGESFEDTIRTIDGYCDVMVIRHPSEGTAKLAAEVAEAPVINGGDGSREHPTQALVDLYTIWRLLGKIDGIKVAFMADLKYARTVNSLLLALTLYNDVEVYLASPPQLKLRSEIEELLVGRGLRMKETSNIEEALREADVLYMTRIQQERFPSKEEYIKVKGIYKLTTSMLRGVKDTLIILHPLPRREELPVEIDATKHAAYFKQARFGVPVRMALLSLITGRV